MSGQSGVVIMVDGMGEELKRVVEGGEEEEDGIEETMDEEVRGMMEDEVVGAVEEIVEVVEGGVTITEEEMGVLEAAEEDSDEVEAVEKTVPEEEMIHFLRISSHPTFIGVVRQSSQV